MESVEKAESLDAVNNAVDENSSEDLKENGNTNAVSSEDALVEEEKSGDPDLDPTGDEAEAKDGARLEEDNVASFSEEDKKEQQKERPLFFVIQEYSAKKGNELTNGEQPLIRNSTIEELKLKLENKEILVRQRPNTPTSPLSPNTPTTPTKQDLSGEDSEDMIPETRAPALLTDDGLIAPRKPVNPVREDPGRQNLHKELLFNQKIGKSVLNQKSELQRALERHKDNVAKKQLENHISAKTPELEKVIADRARRLENPVKKEENEDDKVINKEFLQARMKLKSTSEVK